MPDKDELEILARKTAGELRNTMGYFSGLPFSKSTPIILAALRKAVHEYKKILWKKGEALREIMEIPQLTAHWTQTKDFCHGYNKAISDCQRIAAEGMGEEDDKTSG